MIGYIFKQSSEFLLTKVRQQLRTFIINFYGVYLLQEPESNVLSQRGEYQMINEKTKLQIIKETYQYISILKTLNAHPNQPDILTCNDVMKKYLLFMHE